MPCQVAIAMNTQPATHELAHRIFPSPGYVCSVLHHATSPFAAQNSCPQKTKNIILVRLLSDSITKLCAILVCVLAVRIWRYAYFSTNHLPSADVTYPSNGIFNPLKFVHYRPRRKTQTVIICTALFLSEATVYCLLHGFLDTHLLIPGVSNTWPAGHMWPFASTPVARTRIL